MADGAPSPGKLRAATLLCAACEKAADVSYDEDDLDNLQLVVEAEELRVMAADSSRGLRRS